MGPAGLARMGVNVLTASSVTKVVNDVISNNVNVVTTADAIRVWAGKIVIGFVVIDMCTANVNEKWDAVADKFRGKEIKVEVTDVSQDGSA